MHPRPFHALPALLILAGCAAVPTAPDVMALPGTGKNFEEFRADDMACRDYAFLQIGGKAREQSANNAAVAQAAVGTAIGAVAGAAIGGQRGAGVGAGTGLIVGSASGASAAQNAGYGSQRHYDMAYVQCMYAKGHRVPVSVAYTPSPAGTSSALPPPPPAGATPPPPPAGTPPPPPPVTR
jgi:hypothetical protein